MGKPFRRPTTASYRDQGQEAGVAAFKAGIIRAPAADPTTLPAMSGWDSKAVVAYLSGWLAGWDSANLRNALTGDQRAALDALAVGDTSAYLAALRSAMLGEGV